MSETNIRRRKLLLGAAAAATTPFWINSVRAQEGPIRIGYPVPLTGPYAAEAKDQVQGAELAIMEFNESGGLNGRKCEFLVLDTKLSPGEAATRTL